MLATLIDGSDPHWLFDLKWDGRRALARVENGQWEPWSRSGREVGPRPGFESADFTILRLPGRLR
jgi:ATP-dependent DNA ligase